MKADDDEVISLASVREPRREIYQRAVAHVEADGVAETEAWVWQVSSEERL